MFVKKIFWACLDVFSENLISNIHNADMLISLQYETFIKLLPYFFMNKTGTFPSSRKTPNMFAIIILILIIRIFFSFHKDPKSLDLCCRMDLDILSCFGEETPVHTE